MDTSSGIVSNKPGNKAGLGARVMRNPVVRILLGTLLTFGGVPLIMLAAAALVDKPYRVVWPQLLAAVVVWYGYQIYARRVEKRQPTELATPGMARELGIGVLLGAGLVVLTFAVLALLGAYRFDGINPPGLPMLLPLAELVLVGMAEEMVFRGVIFGVVQRSLGSKAAIVISALLFSLAHLPNDGVSMLAVAAIAAYGVMQAAIYMATGRLWACIGTHIGWNYVLSQGFSSSVSGHAADSGLLRGQLTGDARLTGGMFGVEGSLITVLLIAAAAAWWLRRAGAARTTAAAASPSPAR